MVIPVLVLAAAASNAQPPKADAVQILRAVIAREARDYGEIPGDVRPCVKRTLTQSSFDALRRNRARPVPVTPARKVIGPSSMIGDRIVFHWMAEVPGDATKLAELPERERREISAAFDAIVARGETARLVRAVDPGWLTSPYRLCRKGRRVPSLQLTSPAIQGDIAFVQVDFDCVLCGHGGSYVLWRTRSGWRIVAEQWSWFS
jgi:hypothetical protein